MQELGDAVYGRASMQLACTRAWADSSGAQAVAAAAAAAAARAATHLAESWPVPAAHHVSPQAPSRERCICSPYFSLKEGGPPRLLTSFGPA